MFFIKNSLMTFTILIVAIWVMPVKSVDIDEAHRKCTLILEKLKPFNEGLLWPASTSQANKGKSLADFRRWIASLGVLKIYLSSWIYNIHQSIFEEEYKASVDTKLDIAWHLSNDYEESKNKNKFEEYCGTLNIQYFKSIFAQ